MHSRLNLVNMCCALKTLSSTFWIFAYIYTFAFKHRVKIWWPVPLRIGEVRLEVRPGLGKRSTFPDQTHRFLAILRPGLACSCEFDQGCSRNFAGKWISGDRQTMENMYCTHGQDSTMIDPTFSNFFSIKSLHSADSSTFFPRKFSNSYSETC